MSSDKMKNQIDPDFHVMLQKAQNSLASKILDREDFEVLACEALLHTNTFEEKGYK